MGLSYVGTKIWDAEGWVVGTASMDPEDSPQGPMWVGWAMEWVAAKATLGPGTPRHPAKASQETVLAPFWDPGRLEPFFGLPDLCRGAIMPFCALTSASGQD